jgi:hypothetical protein
MYHRKLWKLLGSLNKTELAHFDRWLTMELDGRQASMRAMASWLLERFPEPVSTEEIWSFLFPRRDQVDPPRVRKLIWDLTVWLEEYIALQMFRKEKRLQEVYVLRHFNSRQEVEWFAKSARRFEAEGREESISPEDFLSEFYEQVELQRFCVKHPEVEDLSPPPLAALHRPLDLFWLHERLPLTVLPFFGVAAGYGPEKLAALLPEAQRLLDHPLVEEYLPLQVWKLLFQLSQRQDESLAQQIFELISTREAEFHPESLKPVHSLLLIYYTRQVRQRRVELIARLIELVEWGVARKVMLIDGLLPAAQYRNVITLYLRAEAYDRALSFAKSHQKYLPAQQAEETSRFCLSLIYYHQKDYDQFFPLVGEHRFENLLFEVNARSLLLQAYYERGEESEWLIGQTENFIRFVRAQKELPDLHRQAYLNRLKIFRRLIRAGLPSLLRRLKEDLGRMKQVDNPEWLSEQIDRKQRQLLRRRR